MDADSACNWYNKGTADNLVAAQSWTRYDPLIAIPRLVEQFARRELRLTFFVPGWVIEKYPTQLDLLLKNGHEIALHGYLHERSNEINKDDELYWLGRGLDAHASTSAPGRAAGGRRASPSQNIRCAICSRPALNTIPRLWATTFPTR